MTQVLGLAFCLVCPPPNISTLHKLGYGRALRWLRNLGGRGNVNAISLTCRSGFSREQIWIEHCSEGCSCQLGIAAEAAPTRWTQICAIHDYLSGRLLGCSLTCPHGCFDTIRGCQRRANGDSGLRNSRSLRSI